MSYNSFDYYKQLREYQLHIKKVTNPESKVPNHQAFKPTKPNIQRAKEYQRNKKVEQIERENQHIMSKLININKRGHQISKSTSSLSLPKIKKQVNIPLYEQQNNQIAKRIIESKSSINTLGLIDRHRSVQQRKKNISKYYSIDGVLINRKKYLAELMLLKKMRVSQVMKNSK